MPVPSQDETGRRFRALTAPPAGQTGTAAIPTLTGDPASDARSEVPLVAYSATSRKKRKLAEKKAAKRAELANQQGNDVLPADTVSQQGEEADVDMRKDGPELSQTILEYIRKAKEGILSNEELLAAGREVMNEMNNDVVLIKRQVDQIEQKIDVYKGQIDRITRIEDLDPELLDREDQLCKQRKTLLEKLTPAGRLKHTLSKYRSMGFPSGMNADDFAFQQFGIHLSQDSKQAENSPIKQFTDAFGFYPTDWLTHSIDNSKMTVQYANRGFYSFSQCIITLKHKHMERATAYHELAHRFEAVVPGLLDAECAYYKTRTAGEATIPLNRYGVYERGEFTKPDHFVHPYMGKVYADPHTFKQSNRTPYELCSMGFQYLFTEPELLESDKNMQEWLLGLLLLK